MADREILNFHSKKTAFGKNSKFKVLPVRCQTNTLLKSEGKRQVNFDHGSTLMCLVFLDAHDARHIVLLKDIIRLFMSVNVAVENKKCRRH